MGVKSLQSFLKNNESYVSERILFNNSHLVIDGNNLLCQLYIFSCLDKLSPHYRSDIYGGDIVLYEKIVRDFFNALKSCKITPILVFDGSVIGKSAFKEFVASKEKETYRRGLSKFNLAKTMTEFPESDDLQLPQTLNTVFRNVITEYGITRLQSPYEADSHIARVANEKNCPVLTNDSDFIIYALRRGFILLDWFDFKYITKDQRGQPAIKSNLFSQRKLSKSLPGLRPECLPLMSVILGNDYAEAGTFDRVVETICNIHYNGFFEARSFNHRRIANMLTWLRLKQLGEATDLITNMVHPNHQEKLKKILNMFMRNYKIEESDDLIRELEAIYDPERKMSDQTDLQPVHYLRKLLENDDLGSICLDMLFHNTHYNYTIIDDFRLPSSGYIKFRPYSLALALLRPQSYTGLTTYKKQLLAENDAFRIFDRFEGQYTMMRIRPMEKLDKFGSLEHLDCHAMILLAPEIKRNIFMECFHFNNDEYDLIRSTVSHVFKKSFVDESAVCMILIKYIAIETKMEPKPQFVDALMIDLFFYAACAGCLNDQYFADPSVYAPLLLKLKSHGTMVNRHNYMPYDKDIFRRIVHFIAQLQSAYKGYTLLNALLDYPFHQAKQGCFANFTLIFRLTKLFRLGNEKLDEMCKDLPKLVDTCETIRTLVGC